MAIILPNYLQTGSYSAKKDRRVNSAEVLQEGIVRKNHYKVAQRAAGANMSVDVAAGEAWVKGDSATDQGYYHVVNDATVNTTVSAANATLPRIDAVVVAVNDSTEVGGSDSYLIEVVAGTPTSGATLGNLKGAPTPGATKLLLAYVLIPAAATSVLTTNIGALRDPRAGQAGYPAEVEGFKAIVGAPPQYAHGRPLDYVPGVRCYNNANQTGTAIGYNTNVFDNDEQHSTSVENSKIFCRTPGLYMVMGSANTAAASSLYCLLSRAGAEEALSIESATSPGTSVNGHGLARMGYGDSIAMAWTVSVTTNALGLTPNLSMIWQGP